MSQIPTGFKPITLDNIKPKIPNGFKAISINKAIPNQESLWTKVFAPIGLGITSAEEGLLHPIFKALSVSGINYNKILEDAQSHYYNELPDWMKQKSIPDIGIYWGQKPKNTFGSIGKLSIGATSHTPGELLAASAAGAAQMAGPMEVAFKAGDLVANKIANKTGPILSRVVRGIIAGSLLGEGDPKKTTENAVQFGLFEAIPAILEKIPEAHERYVLKKKWEQMPDDMKVPVVQSLTEALEKNPKLTEAEAAKMSPNWFKEAIELRSTKEQESSPTPVVEEQKPVSFFALSTKNTELPKGWDEIKIEALPPGQGFGGPFNPEDIYSHFSSELANRLSKKGELPPPPEGFEYKSDPGELESVSVKPPKVKKTNIKENEEPLVLDEETFLNLNKATRDFGEPALHHNVPYGKQRDKLLDEFVVKPGNKLLKKRKILSEEYKKLVKRGIIREPTRVEILISKAKGNEDLEATHAARRLLSKRGIDWDKEKDVIRESTERYKEGIQGTPKEDNKTITELPTSEIHSDPVRFQYKRFLGDEGVSSTLKNIDKYDPELGGLIAVWRDPKDGKTYVVNGHHRLELARRTGQETLAVRYLKANTAEEAKLKGALINIAEGQGKPEDAAIVFRDTGITPDKLEKEYHVSLRGKIAKEGLALSRLHSTIFDAIERGEIPRKWGIAIGENLEDKRAQLEVVKYLERLQKQHKNINSGVLEQLIKDIKGDVVAKTNIKENTLFGAETFEKPLLLERAEIRDYAVKELSKEKRLFSTVGKRTVAKKLEVGGNVIDVEKSKNVAERAAIAKEIFERLANTKGEISDALNEAAQDLHRAKSRGEKNAIKHKFLQRLRAVVEEIISKTETRSDKGDNGFSEGTGKVKSKNKETGGITFYAGLPFDKISDAIMKSETIKGLVKDMRNLVAALAPTHISETAQKGEAIIRSRLGEKTQAVSRFIDSTKKARMAFDWLSKNKQIEIVKGIEEGITSKEYYVSRGIPKRIAKTVVKYIEYRKPVFDFIWKKLNENGLLTEENYINNYIAHLWKDEEEAKEKFQEFLKKTLKGSSFFTKARNIDLYKTGIDLGLEPKYTNPIDIDTYYISEAHRLLSTVNMIKDLKEEGLWKFVRVGNKPPEGWVKIKDPIADVIFSTEEGPKIAGHYYCPEDIGRLLNNMVSPGMYGRIKLYDIARTVNNIANTFNLGVSLYHATFSAITSGGHELALLFSKLSRGAISDAIKDMWRITPAGAIRGIIKGDYYRKIFLNPELAKSVSDKTAIEILKIANYDPFLDRYYALSAVEGFKRAIKQGKILSAAVKLPVAIIEKVGSPLLEHIIPNIKANALIDTAIEEILRRKPTNPEEYKEIVTDAYNMVEDRFGQMTYDNLFWNRTLKDSLMILLRSVGWNWGDLREVAGASANLGTILKKLFIEGKLPTQKDISNRIFFVISLPLMVGLWGAIYDYLKGVKAKKLIDYFLLPSGRFNKDGSETKYMFASYLKDWIAALHESPLQMFKNKMSPVASAVVDLLTNEDYWKNQIYGEDTWPQDIVKYLGKHFLEPFSLEQMYMGYKEGQPITDIMEPFFGIIRAPRYLTNTDAQNYIWEKYRDMKGVSFREMRDRLEWKRKARLEFRRTGKISPKTLEEGIKRGFLTSRRAVRMFYRSLYTPVEAAMFRQLPWEIQVKALFKAKKSSERALLERYASRHALQVFYKQQGEKKLWQKDVFPSL